MREEFSVMSSLATTPADMAQPCLQSVAAPHSGVLSIPLGLESPIAQQLPRDSPATATVSASMSPTTKQKDINGGTTSKMKTQAEWEQRTR